MEEMTKEAPTVTISYAIYSVEDMTAKHFAECKRGHWSIENSDNKCPEQADGDHGVSYGASRRETSMAAGI